MIRFQLDAPKFESPRASDDLRELKTVSKKVEARSICGHMAGVKLHDARRNLMFDVARNAALNGSENGSDVNMLLNTNAEQVWDECAGRSEFESCAIKRHTYPVFQRELVVRRNYDK
jgi:hypothetical protein